MVRNRIQRRHIDSGNGRRHLQEIFPGCSGGFPSLIQIHQFKIVGLSFSDIEQIEEVSQRFRIVGTGAAADHKRMFFGTFRRHQRDLRQIQDLKNVGIAHLVLDRDAQEIKILHRILGFQGEQRDLPLPHDLVQVCPWGVDALTPDIIPAVEHVV